MAKNWEHQALQRAAHRQQQSSCKGRSALCHPPLQQVYLPTTAEGIVRYLAEYGEKLAISTLRQRLAALVSWHSSQGFPDPTKSPQVR